MAQLDLFNGIAARMADKSPQELSAPSAAEPPAAKPQPKGARKKPAKSEALWAAMLEADPALRALPPEERAPREARVRGLVERRAALLDDARDRHAARLAQMELPGIEPANPSPDKKHRGKSGEEASAAKAIAALPRREPSYRFAVDFDLWRMADECMLPIASMRELFISGRFFSQIGEEISAPAFGFSLFPNKDVGGADGYCFACAAAPDGSEATRALPPKTPMDFISVKGTGKNRRATFQLSVLTGAGRDQHCDRAALRESIALTEWICVTDVTREGRAEVFLFPSEFALDWESAGILSASGISLGNLRAALAASSTAIVDLSERARACRDAIRQANAAERAALDPPPAGRGPEPA